jgi:predicted nucleotidyltransferase
MPDKLDKNILATIIYYNGLEYPLTAFEVWKYLIRTDYYANDDKVIQTTLAGIIKQLHGKGLKAYIENQSGFYFFKGQNYLVKKRIENNKISAGKINKLVRIAKWLRLIPFVKMIGVTGALAMKNAKPKSDLDILIVFEYGKIWTGRTLVTLFLHAIGKRRHGTKIVDRVCLNFFVTDNSLEIITKDLFSASEYMFLFPLYGLPIYERFQIKNQWIRTMKPSYAPSELPPLKTFSDSILSKSIRTVGEKILSAEWLENWLKKVEKKRIMQNPKTHQEGSMVYADDNALIFLPKPHGPKVFEQFKENVSKLSL